MLETPERVSVSAAPERSVAQRMEALTRANDVRGYRKELKGQLKARERSPLDVLREVPPEIATMKVFDLLMAIPKFGRVKVNKMLGRVRISPSKTVGGLSERQRRELVLLVAPYMRYVRTR